MTEIQTTIKYRYIVTDLLSNQILAEIPFTGVTYERALKSAGKFQGNISINIDTQGLDLYNSTMPGRTGLYIMRNDECVWGGIIWSREYNVTGQELSVSASEFTSYLHHRKIWKTFLREFNGVKVNRFNASLLKVKLPSGSPITISSGSTVELIFDEARAYNYRGHYKVVGDYVNASTIYVEDVPVEAFTGKPIAFDGDYREDETKKSQIKTYKITNREMKKGSKEVTLSTKYAHGLLPGDYIDISGVDVGINLSDYTVTTGDSTPLTVDRVNFIFNKFIYSSSSKVKYQFRGFIPSYEMCGYAIEPDFDDALQADGYVFININGPDYSPYPFIQTDDTGWILQYGTTNKPSVGVDYFGIYPGDQITLNGFGIEDDIMFDGEPTFTGDNRLNGTFVVQDVYVEGFPFNREPSSFNWENAFFVLTIKFRLPRSGNNPYYAELGNSHIYDYFDNKPNYTFNGPYRGVKEIGDFQAGQTIIVSNAYDNQYLSNKEFKIAEVESWSDPFGAYSQSILINTPEFAKWTTAFPPTIPGTSNATVTRVAHYKSQLKNVAATEVNKLSNQIIAVPTANTFTVLSTLDSSISSNVAQTQAKAKWNPVYKATMHANTDTYDYVRLLLGHVFSDFSTVPSSSGFLGTDVTNGIRKITYDESEEKVLLETGFVESAYSKEIKQDVRIINSVQLEKNLATAYLTSENFTITAGSFSGSNTIVTYTSNNSLIPGDVVSIEIPASTSSYEVEGAVVTAANATSFTVLSETPVTGAFSGTGTAFKHHPFNVGDVITISGVDAELGLNRTVFDITTKIESVPDKSSVTFSVVDEATINLSSVSPSSPTIKTDFYVKLQLPKPYDQFYASYFGELTDVGEYVTIYGNDISINGTFPIKKISPNKDYLEYFIPDGTETKAISYLSPDSTTIVFGAHGLIPGNTITIRGLADLNYDGTFVVSSIPSLTSLEYSHVLPEVEITHYRTRRTSNGLGTVIYLKLASKPTYGSYVENVTQVYIKNVPVLSDGTYTVHKYFTPDEIKVKNTEKLTSGYYLMIVRASDLSIQLTPPINVPINQSDRLYGSSINISNVRYVANKKTGTGNTTFRTSTSHGLAANDVVYLTNIGGLYTQKISTSNAYSWLTAKVLSVPNTTAFIVDQNSLYPRQYGTNVNVGKSNIAFSTISGGTVQKYKTDDKILSSIYATAKITTMSDFYSNQIDQRVKNIVKRAYNKETQEVILQTQYNHGFKVGEIVTIAGVDDPDTIEPVFDGTFVLLDKTDYESLNPTNSIGEYTKNKTLVYKSQSALKSDIGVFLDPDTKDTDLTRKLIRFDNLKPNAGGDYPASAVVEPSMYSATYGSYINNSDLGIEFSTYDYSGAYMRGKNYRGHELTVVADALDEYADKYIVRPGSTKAVRNVHGFEYRIDCYFDKELQSFRRVFVFIPINFPNEPIHGEVSPVSRFGADKLVFEYPGNISEISLQESAEEAATRFWMVGSDGGTGTEGAAKTYVGLSDSYLLADGWPIIEQSEANDQLDYIADITDYAKRYLVETKPPVGAFEVSVNGSYDPFVTSYNPGDWCSLIVKDGFIKQRLLSDLEPRDSVIVRKIVGYSVTVPDGNAFPEQVKLTLIPEWDVDKRD